MANVCYNWIEVVGDAGSISELRDYLEYQDDYYLDIRESTDPTLLVFSLESRWVAPVEFLKVISREHNLLVECESEECSCDYYFKCGYRNGEKIFEINLGYLEGKYHSLDWNDFIESQVVWRLEDPDPFDEFIAEFDFCSDEERAELEELFLNIQTKIKMENLTTGQLLKKLAKRGYVTDGLWTITDAEMELDLYNEENGTSHTLTDEQKMDIVTDALMDDTIVAMMYEIIGNKISDIFNNAI